MGGSKSSSSAATSQTDNRRVLGEGAISAENSNITQTSTVYALDNGAINRAFDTADFSVGEALKFGSEAISSNGSTVARALDFATTAQEVTLDSLNTTANLVKDSYADAKGRGALTDQILIGAIAMAGLVAFAAIRK